jgi:dihydrofolate reductase
MKASVYIGTSLDGFIARSNGNIDWLEQYANEEAVEAYQAFMKNIDVILIGRGTFEKVLSFPTWPYDKKVFVLSTTLKELPRALQEKVSILSMNPPKLLDHLSRLGFSSVYVDGGKVIQSFLREDLIDVLIISKVPVLIGSGLSLFGELNVDLQFKHVKTIVQSNQLIRSYYERDRPRRVPR